MHEYMLFKRLSFIFVGLVIFAMLQAANVGGVDLAQAATSTVREIDTNSIIDFFKSLIP